MDKAKLRAVMIAHNDNQAQLAEALGLSLSALNAKINEYRGAQFWQNEIAYIKERYSLNADDVNDIFFASRLS